MKAPLVACIDFETFPIAKRPAYPPVPVGVSIQEPGEKKARYLAWGHPTENNCSKADAVRQLKKVWTGAHPLLFHHSKFDVDVGQTHLGMPAVEPMRCHDTLFLVFLSDPHAPSFSLKPSAERLLNLPPTEQQDLARWLIANQVQLKAQGLLPEGEKIMLSNFGKWIALGPGKLVGKYADGDVLRTLKLFKLLYPQICDRGMREAYERELKLMPILLENERVGMRCDLRRMEKDVAGYNTSIATAEQWLRKTLKAPELDFEKDREVAEALDKQGIVTEWTTTKTGQRSVSKKNMTTDMFSNAKVANVLGYRNRLFTCLSMYYKNWLRMARETNGTIYTEWNQVRQSHGSSEKGARTGRLSASLVMNVPKTWDDKNDGYTHPTFLEVPELPQMRRYVLPDAKDHWFGRRDFSQQEVRALAHFEDGLLLQAYLDNPKLDVHKFVQEQIQDLLGIKVARTPVKNLNFGFIYSQGINSMAEALNMPSSEVQQLRNAQMHVLPGLKVLNTTLKRRAHAGEALRTWGGREYYCEPPAFSKKFNKQMTFEYKMLNVLVQGSCADLTKEAILRYHALPVREGRMICTVHDEIDISAPKGAFKEEMLRLREVMLSLELDLPLLSDAEYGPNWAELKDLREPEAELTRWGIGAGWSK